MSYEMPMEVFNNGTALIILVGLFFIGSYFIVGRLAERFVSRKAK